MVDCEHAKGLHFFLLNLNVVVALCAAAGAVGAGPRGARVRDWTGPPAHDKVTQHRARLHVPAQGDLKLLFCKSILMIH